MKKYDVLYLHIGLPKTGSTFIQKSMCGLTTKGLLKRTAYPVVPGCSVGNASQLAVASRASAPQPAEEHLRARLQEILAADQSGCRDLLISSELFFAESARLDTVVRLLLEHANSVKLIVCVRPLAPWIYSIYMQQVKAHAVFSEYGEEYRSKLAPTLLGFFRDLSATDVALGCDSVVLAYREPGLLEDFLGSVGEDASLAGEVGESRVNRSLSQPELDLLRLVNGIYRNFGLSETISHAFIAANSDVDSAKVPLASREAYEAFAAAFETALGELPGELMAGIRGILFSAEDQAVTYAQPGAGIEHADLLGMVLTAVRDATDKAPAIAKSAKSFELLRKYSAQLEPTTDFFDPIHYMLMYPDILHSGIDPWDHYLTHGRSEGRNAAYVKPDMLP